MGIMNRHLARSLILRERTDTQPCLLAHDALIMKNKMELFSLCKVKDVPGVTTLGCRYSRRKWRRICRMTL